jgi:hypothetical protein
MRTSRWILCSAALALGLDRAEEVRGVVLAWNTPSGPFVRAGGALHGLWLRDDPAPHVFVNVGARTHDVTVDRGAERPYGTLVVSEAPLDCAEVAAHFAAVSDAVWDLAATVGDGGPVETACDAIDALIAADPALALPRPDGAWTLRAGTGSAQLDRWTGWDPGAMWDPATCSFDPRSRWRGRQEVGFDPVPSMAVVVADGRATGHVRTWFSGDVAGVADLRFDVAVCDVDGSASVQIHHRP